MPQRFAPGDQRASAPLGMNFDTLEQIRDHSDRIWTRAGDSATPCSHGGPPASTRAELGEWLACGAPSTSLFAAASDDRSARRRQAPAPDSGMTASAPLSPARGLRDARDRSRCVLRTDELRSRDTACCIKQDAMPSAAPWPATIARS